jgi:DNA-binding MarR family transcriptional regulator
MTTDRPPPPENPLGYGDAPVVLLVGDGVPSATQRIAEEAGARVVPVDIADAADRLDRQGLVSGVIVELVEDPGAAFDETMARLNKRAGELPCLLIMPVTLTDRSFAAILNPDIVHIAAPDAADRELEVRLLVAGAARRSEIVAEPSARLRQLSDEMVRIAQLLGSLSAEIADLRAALPPGAGPAHAAVDPATIVTMLRARRLRDRFFGANLFADPAWDMLLDLAAARLENRQVAVSSLCIAAAVPPTTALRWIRTMSEAGLFERRADPEDGRRVFIAISDRAANAMSAYLAAAAVPGAPIA